MENSKKDIVQFTPKEKEEFIKRLSTYKTRSAALRELSVDHMSTIKKLWYKSMQHKRQEIDKEKVRLAKLCPEPSKNWQKIILKTMGSAGKGKTLVFIVNNTHNIGSTAGKRRFGEDTPELQNQLREDARKDLDMVNKQINDLASFIVAKTIDQAERADIARIFTCAYRMAKRRKPQNKYLPPTQHQQAYKRVVYKFLHGRNVAHTKKFQNLLPEIAMEAEEITLVFTKKHMNYALLPNMNIIVYELSNMSPYQILSNASGEPTINQLNEKEIVLKALLSSKNK